MRTLVTHPGAVLPYFCSHTDFIFLQPMVFPTKGAITYPDYFSAGSVGLGGEKEVYFSGNFHKAWL